MDIEEQSIEFLERMMATEFAEIMAQYLVLDIDWIEWENEGEIRGVARMGDMEGNKEIKCGLICLFPPFKLDSSK